MGEEIGGWRVWRLVDQKGSAEDGKAVRTRSQRGHDGDFAPVPERMDRPAALQMHHAEIGGLMHHVCSMLECAECIAGVYPFLDRDLLLAGVVVHDLAKTREMNLNGLGLVSDYSADGMLTGHITLGVCAVAEASARTGHGGCEEEMLLRHMVLSHHEKPEFGSPVPPRFPEAHVLSAIDSLDAVMFEMEDVLKNTAPGTMSGRANALRRELYRRQGIAGAAQQRSAPPQNDAPEEDSGICR